MPGVLWLFPLCPWKTEPPRVYNSTPEKPTVWHHQDGAAAYIDSRDAATWGRISMAHACKVVDDPGPGKLNKQEKEYHKTFTHPAIIVKPDLGPLDALAKGFKNRGFINRDRVIATKVIAAAIGHIEQCLACRERSPLKGRNHCRKCLNEWVPLDSPAIPSANYTADQIEGGVREIGHIESETLNHEDQLAIDRNRPPEFFPGSRGSRKSQHFGNCDRNENEGEDSLPQRAWSALLHKDDEHDPCETRWHRQGAIYETISGPILVTLLAPEEFEALLIYEGIGQDPACDIVAMARRSKRTVAQIERALWIARTILDDPCRFVEPAPFFDPGDAFRPRSPCRHEYRRSLPATGPLVNLNEFAPEDYCPVCHRTALDNGKVDPLPIQGDLNRYVGQ